MAAAPQEPSDLRRFLELGVPDDARALQAEVEAYRAELRREARRAHRERVDGRPGHPAHPSQLGDPFRPGRAGVRRRVAVVVVSGALGLVAVAGLMLAALAPGPVGGRFAGPPSGPLATGAGARGTLGGLLPGGRLLVAGAWTAAADLPRPAVYLVAGLGPGDVGRAGLAQEQAGGRGLALVVVAASPGAAERLVGGLAGGAVAAGDPGGVWTTAFGGSLVFVRADGVITDVLRGAVRRSDLGFPLDRISGVSGVAPVGSDRAGTG